MRKSWVSHRFDEVFDLQMGKTPARDNPSYWGEGNIWVSIADMKDVKYISSSKEQITDVAVRESGIKPVKKGTAIMSFKLSIGKAAIANTDLYTNEAIMSFSVKNGHRIKPEFIYYFLKGFKWAGANKAVMGLTLNKKTIASNFFSYPPIAEQERIVAELDCLTGIIEKKKQQLEELDKLTQSIFYDMFGDPIANEKGWEMKKLGDVATVLDSKRKPITKSDRKAGVYPYYGATGIQDYVEGFIFDGRYLLLGEDGARWGAGDKSAFIIEGKSWVNNHAHVLQIGNGAKDVYIQYHLNICDLLQYITGAIVPKLTQASMVRIPIMLPPLDLQNEFAQKIEAIEKQKELVKRSIVETETLFNSRMDYWFNY